MEEQIICQSLAFTVIAYKFPARILELYMSGICYLSLILTSRIDYLTEESTLSTWDQPQTYTVIITASPSYSQQPLLLVFTVLTPIEMSKAFATSFTITTLISFYISILSPNYLIIFHRLIRLSPPLHHLLFGQLNY